MEYRNLGKSGLKISLLSFGSWVTFHNQLADQQADELMGVAFDAGVNFFDNAEVYSRGESEKLMGRVLKRKQWERSSYILSSKAFFGWRGKENKPNQTGLSSKHLTEACQEALQRLQVDYLDLFFCHRPDPQTPVDEVVWTMNMLIQQGKILYWGTSEWESQEILAAMVFAEKNHLIGPTMEQPEYNLFHREKMERDFLPIFKDWGLGTTTWSPLASGLLTGKYNSGIPDGSRLTLEGYQWLKEQTLEQQKLEKVTKLKLLADDWGTSLPILSISWCISNPRVSTAILGATRKEQLQENLRAIDFYPDLGPERLSEIDAIMGN